tara:strand:+ start:771 stop:1703 length:933 start_codon:yes stop_codon:yes gene_type:complete
MSNILIIKHGSLGDLIQANGAMKDIKQSFPNDKVLLLTTSPYTHLMSYCPYINGVLIDKRLPRWNVFYLLKLKKTLERFSFTKVFDLQNSSRTKFYRNFFFKNIDCSSTETSLEKDQKKSDFDKEPVLKRMKIQLEKSGINTNFTENPDLSWAIRNVQSLMNQYIEGNYIAIFPFCSSKHKAKVWPYFTQLIKEIKNIYGKKYEVVIAPGPNEINEAKKLNANVILNKESPLNLMELVGLIKGSSYVISNDTGAAHISSHLNKKGLVLFGSHTSAKKVSLGSENFRSIEVKKLKDLEVSTVIEKIRTDLN